MNKPTIAKTDHELLVEIHEMVTAMKPADKHPTVNSKNLDAFIRLGNIILKEAGAEACQKGYGTTDPAGMGRSLRSGLWR